jgi:hypothetical protein
MVSRVGRAWEKLGALLALKEHVSRLSTVWSPSIEYMAETVKFVNVNKWLNVNTGWTEETQRNVPCEDRTN